MSVHQVYGSSGISAVDKLIVFVIGNKEFSIAIRYLVAHDYFYTLLNQKMRESQTGRIVIEEHWYTVFPAFLEYLKTGLFSVTDFLHTYQLYELAHRYQIQALLKATSSELIKEISSRCGELLLLGYAYEDEEIKNSCLNYIDQFYMSNQTLFHQLIALKSASAFGVIEMLLDRNTPSLRQLMTSKEIDGKTILSKLLGAEQYSLTSKFIQVARKLNILEFSSNHLEMIYQLLAECPSLEKLELITTIVRGRTSMLYTYLHAKEPPLHLVLVKGWHEAFTILLSCCTDENCMLRNLQQGKMCLLTLAIAKKDFEAVKALKKHAEKFPFQEAQVQEYVLNGIKAQSTYIIEILLSFPVDPRTQNPKRVNAKGIESALAFPDLLKKVWPHNNMDNYSKAELYKSIYEKNRLDLASAIFIFDASKEHFPSSNLPWIHYITSQGSLNWLRYIVSQCTNLNESAQVRNGVYRTPLNLALELNRSSEYVYCLLEAGVDCSIINKGVDGIFNPLHHVLYRKDVDLLCWFLRKNPNLAAEDQIKRNFFHLFFLSESIVLPVNVLEELIRKAPPACLEAKDHEGNTPLHYAVKAQHQAGIFNILFVKSSLLWSTNKDSRFPLQMVTGKQFEETLQQLASPRNTVLALKNDLLLWCAEECLYHFCERLIREGADIQVVTQKEGKSLLHFAVEGGAHLALERLISLGVSVNLMDLKRRTALHYAVLRADPKAVGLLMDKAELNILDFQNETPLSYALKAQINEPTLEMQEIIDLLESKSCPIQ